MKRSTKAYSLALVVFFMAGCSTTGTGTNRTAKVPVPTLSATDSVADVEITTPISGRVCAKEVLVFFSSGDTNYLNPTGEIPKTQTDKAKAAAVYNALRGSGGLTTDIIVNPVWHIERDRTFFGIFRDDVCAEVAGFRGVIKNFKKSTTVTSSGKEVETKKSLLSFLPFF